MTETPKCACMCASGVAPDRPYTYLKTVQGVCRECKKIVNARIIEEDGRIYQERMCPEHGKARALIAENSAWYLDVMKRPIEPREPKKRSTKVSRGCPHDCGMCTFHATGCNLPVFSITNACNLNCPICFTYNRPDKIWHMPLEEVDKVLDYVIECAGTLDLINITGGEPTMHPQIIELLEKATSRPEIGRVTMNSNGLILAKNEELCKELARLGVYVILSMDTFDAERSVKIHGRDIVDIKKKAIENLGKYDIGTTLLNVMIRDVNEDEIGQVLELAATQSHIRSVTIQTMTYTGFGGKDFPRTEHMTIDGAIRAIETASDGEYVASDFHPMPAAHPLCYSISYFFRCEGKLYPFKRLFSEEEIRRIIGPNYLIRPGDEFHDILKDALNRLWAEGGDPAILDVLKKLTKETYPADGALSPFERQRVAERHVVTCYIHAHMDEDNFDLSRVSTCPDLVPDVKGTLTPACAYNVFYRMKDSRFWVDDDGEK